MTTREKVIVGVASIAVAIGGGRFVRDQLSGQSGGEDAAGSAVGTIRAFVDRSHAHLSGVQVTGAEQAAMTAAQGDWDGQPFAVAPPPEEVDVPELAASSFRYSGYIQAGSRRFAIINGREYEVNDVLADHAGIVQAIEPGHVVLRVGPYGRRQMVPLIKPVKPGEMQ